MNYTDLFSNVLPIYVSKKTGLKFYYRPNTSDIKTIIEVVERGVYEKKYFKIQKGEHWVDLGGNIGAFTLLALSKGATVDVYEADNEHCELIKMNLALNELTANVINKAVVHDDTKEIYLNIQKNGNTWRNSIVKNWGGGKKKIECINIETILNNNVCCKMDIEGSEMLILETIKSMPKKIVYEWSFDIDDNIDRYRNVLKKMISNYENVKHNSIKDEHKIWQKAWFPPCRNVYCF
jgi:FkbM family methyltransferase